MIHRVRFHLAPRRMRTSAVVLASGLIAAVSCRQIVGIEDKHADTTQHANRLVCESAPLPPDPCASYTRDHCCSDVATCQTQAQCAQIHACLAKCEPSDRPRRRPACRTSEITELMSEWPPARPTPVRPSAAWSAEDGCFASRAARPTSSPIAAILSWPVRRMSPVAPWKTVCSDALLVIGGAMPTATRLASKLPTRTSRHIRVPMTDARRIAASEQVGRVSAARLGDHAPHQD